MSTLREQLISAVQTKPAESVNPQIFYFESGVDEFDIDYSKLDKRFQQFPVYTWMCTDTMVGIYAIALDGTLVAYTTQEGRKCHTNMYYINREMQDWAVQVVQQCRREKETQYNLVDDQILDSDITAVNIFENRMLATEFPALANMNIFVEKSVVHGYYDVFEGDTKIAHLPHPRIDTAEKCAKDYGVTDTAEYFIKIFFKSED